MTVRAISFAAIALLAATLCGCAGSPPVHFYTLSPEAQADSSQIAAETPLRISVGPVSVPDAVDRPHVIVRTGPNQVSLTEEHRWAEPLKTGIPRVIAENLSRLLATREVWAYPQTAAGPVDYRVQVAIQRFESTPGQGVAIDALWSVQPSSANEKAVKAGLKTGRSSVQQPVTGSGYDALAAAHSRALAAISHEIAEAIRSFPGTTP